jgi:hypothetical protein
VHVLFSLAVKYRTFLLIKPLKEESQTRRKKEQEKHADKANDREERSIRSSVVLIYMRTAKSNTDKDNFAK